MFETSNGLDLYSYIRNPLGCKKTPIKMMERHAAQAPAPPACKPTGWKRCASDILKSSIVPPQADQYSIPACPIWVLPSNKFVVNINVYTSNTKIR
jgi:hypothetical protein